MSRIAVLGATGFIGSAVMETLRSEGHDAAAVRTPRLPPMADGAADEFLQNIDARATLVAALQGADAVINTAGDPRATGVDIDALIAANGVLPGLVASVLSEHFPNLRFVHVSSAAVQGNAAVLDDRQVCEDDLFSAYSRSKAIGERLVLRCALDAVVFRPPGVHAAHRPVTQAVARFARSPIRSVARPASSPSAQALLTNVAAAIVFLATTPLTPRTIVTHPSEGVTTDGLLADLGGRTPHHLPRAVARALLHGLSLAERATPRLAGHRRRLEMLWFGQSQASSWLTEVGWTPPEGRTAWQDLGRELAAARTSHT